MVDEWLMTMDFLWDDLPIQKNQSVNLMMISTGDFPNFMGFHGMIYWICPLAFAQPVHEVVGKSPCLMGQLFHVGPCNQCN